MPGIIGRMRGTRGLFVRAAIDRSMVWGIAKAVRAQGAEPGTAAIGD